PRSRAPATPAHCFSDTGSLCGRPALSLLAQNQTSFRPSVHSVAWLLLLPPRSFPPAQVCDSLPAIARVSRRAAEPPVLLIRPSREHQGWTRAEAGDGRSPTSQGPSREAARRRGIRPANDGLAA